MNATVQIVTENLEAGETNITFGPPKHLGAATLIQLLNVNRFRFTFVNPSTQINSTAQVPGDQTTLGDGTAISDSSSGPVASQTDNTLAVYQQPAAGGGAVTLPADSGHQLATIPVPPAPVGSPPNTPATPDPAQGTGGARGSSLVLYSTTATIPITANASTTDVNATAGLFIADLKGGDGNYHPISFQEVQICVAGVQQYIIVACSSPYTY